jgi:hypothetical protein
MAVEESPLANELEPTAVALPFVASADTPHSVADNSGSSTGVGPTNTMSVPTLHGASVSAQTGGAIRVIPPKAKAVVDARKSRSFLRRIL